MSKYFAKRASRKLVTYEAGLDDELGLSKGYATKLFNEVLDDLDKHDKKYPYTEAEYALSITEAEPGELQTAWRSYRFELDIKADSERVRHCFAASAICFATGGALLLGAPLLTSLGTGVGVSVGIMGEFKRRKAIKRLLASEKLKLRPE